MTTIVAKAPKAYDRLTFIHVSKLMNMLWFCDGVHLGSSIFGRIDDLVEWVEPTIDFS
tara:strand:- start:858 stop:1031 length:174 start_codon:yes stop_codon:yes gene_type:complete